MKKIILFSSTLILSFCQSQKNAIDLSNSQFKNNIIESNCPADGTCSLELIKNKSIQVNRDEIGYQSYILNENKEKSVVKFQYSKNVDKELQDAGYVEEVLFEIENNINSLELSDSELKNVNLIFGRHCFCKGQAGIFNISQGNLKIIRNKSGLEFSLTFKNSNTPQKINIINGKFN